MNAAQDQHRQKTAEPGMTESAAALRVHAIAYLSGHRYAM